MHLPEELGLDYILLSLPKHEIVMLDPPKEEIVEMLVEKMEHIPKWCMEYLEQKYSPNGIYFIDNDLS